MAIDKPAAHLIFHLIEHKIIVKKLRFDHFLCKRRSTFFIIF